MEATQSPIQACSAEMHVDDNNHGSSYITALGDGEGCVHTRGDTRWLSLVPWINPPMLVQDGSRTGSSPAAIQVIVCLSEFLTVLRHMSLNNANQQGKYQISGQRQAA